MLKIFKMLVIALVLIYMFPISSKAEEYINYNDLIENAKALDGKYIELKGEAIGESMRRGSYTWVNISDGSNAMGIWLTNQEANKVKTYGSYKFKGDIVKVSGTFSRACSDHGGDMDIHGESLTIVESGHKVELSLSEWKMKVAAIFSVITLILFGVYYKRKMNKW